MGANNSYRTPISGCIGFLLSNSLVSHDTMKPLIFADHLVVGLDAPSNKEIKLHHS